MLFETSTKAGTFIKFNKDEIEEESGFAPKRSYFCIACGGWHVTSRDEIPNYKSRTEVVLEKYEEQKKSEELRAQQPHLGENKRKEEVKDIYRTIAQNIVSIENSIKNKIDCTELFEVTLSEFERAKAMNISFKGGEKKKKNAEIKLDFLKAKLMFLGPG